MPILGPIPIGDDNPTELRPWVNHALIALNVAIFVAYGFRDDYGVVVAEYGLVPALPSLLDAFAAMFLHAGAGHLIGNMLFLWIYGDNVEDALGHVGYALFYLAGGLMAALIHGLATADKLAPMIGASGAISAVLGAYLLIYPKTKITFAGLLFFVKPFKFQLWAFVALGGWFVFQLLDQMDSDLTANVAYAAHIGGFIAGFAVMGLLVMGGRVEPHWDSAR
ncbi:MAG: rhomboid family intramembrane serine protease [Vulcanimicrobiota bacterium]